MHIRGDHIHFRYYIFYLIVQGSAAGLFIALPMDPFRVAASSAMLSFPEFLGRLHAVPSDHTLCMPSLIRMVCKKALASITTKQWQPASPNGRLLLILTGFVRLISS